MKTYKEFKVTALPFDADIISGLLWQLDIDGINEFDNYLTVFVNETKNISSKDLENILNALAKERLIESFSIEEKTVEDRNWNEEYEKNVKVIEVTDKIVIKPSFKEYSSKPDQLIITIDPKMSFGTGDHATTKLIIQLIEKYVRGGEKVLDVGSGTGILGICAVMLGAKNAIGVDNDEWCLLNGNENVKANNLVDSVKIQLGELKDISEKDFDLIVANINKNILLDIAKELKSKIKKTGILILSGLLFSDENDIINAYSTLNFTLEKKTAMDEWIALALKAY
jgi:ribosomal protein L11 methyltransferase